MSVPVNCFGMTQVSRPSLTNQKELTIGGPFTGEGMKVSDSVGVL